MDSRAESASPALTSGSLPGQEKLPAVPFKVSAVASQLGHQLESRGAGDRKLTAELKEIPAPEDPPETHQPHRKDPRFSGEMHLPSGTEGTSLPRGLCQGWLAAWDLSKPSRLQPWLSLSNIRSFPGLCPPPCPGPWQHPVLPLN